MSKLTKREQYLIIGALLFSIVFLVAYLYYFPLQDEITALEVQAMEIDFQIEEAKQTKILIKTTKDEIEQLEKELVESREFLMDAIDEPDILKYLSDIILADGQLSSISYNIVADNDIFFSKDVGLDFVTSYNGLKNILAAFENGEKFTLMSSISIYPIEERGEMTETTDEEGEVGTIETSVPSSQVRVNLTTRFYGSESTWDGSGEYDFMDGSFGKTNIFN